MPDPSVSRCPLIPPWPGAATGRRRQPPPPARRQHRRPAAVPGAAAARAAAVGGSLRPAPPCRRESGGQQQQQQQVVLELPAAPRRWRLAWRQPPAAALQSTGSWAAAYLPSHPPAAHCVVAAPPAAHSVAAAGCQCQVPGAPVLPTAQLGSWRQRHQPCVHAPAAQPTPPLPPRAPAPRQHWQLVAAGGWPPAGAAPQLRHPGCRRRCCCRLGGCPAGATAGLAAGWWHAGSG